MLTVLRVLKINVFLSIELPSIALTFDPYQHGRMLDHHQLIPVLN
jgi:hypothetical protein